MKFFYIYLLSISLNIFSATIIYTSNYIDVNSGLIQNNHSITIDENLIKSIDSGFIKDDHAGRSADPSGLSTFALYILDLGYGDCRRLWK